MKSVVVKDNDGLLLISRDLETLLEINDYNIDFESALIDGNIELVLDDKRIENLRKEGRAVPCPHESECEVLRDSDKGFVRIMIISGQMKGTIGYVFTRQVQRR